MPLSIRKPIPLPRLHCTAAAGRQAWCTSWGQLLPRLTCRYIVLFILVVRTDVRAQYGVLVRSKDAALPRLGLGAGGIFVWAMGALGKEASHTVAWRAFGISYGAGHGPFTRCADNGNSGGCPVGVEMSRLTRGAWGWRPHSGEFNIDW